MFVCVSHSTSNISEKDGVGVVVGMGWSHNRGGAQMTQGDMPKIFSDYCDLYMRTISKLENTTRHPPPRDCWHCAGHGGGRLSEEEKARTSSGGDLELGY